MRRKSKFRTVETKAPPCEPQPLKAPLITTALKRVSFGIFQASEGMKKSIRPGVPCAAQATDNLRLRGQTLPLRLMGCGIHQEPCSQRGRAQRYSEQQASPSPELAKHNAQTYFCRAIQRQLQSGELSNPDRSFALAQLEQPPTEGHPPTPRVCTKPLSFPE